jgi:AcrR family transcriptional regulator
MRAAYRLIGRDGGSVSVQEILVAAGLSTRAFYRHFAGKEELILSMYRTDNGRVADALWAATETEPDPWRALAAWVDVSLSVAFDKGRERHSQVLGSGEAKSTEGWSQEFLDGTERHLGSLEAVLVRGREDGTFPNTEPRTDAQVIFGATQHFNSVRMNGGPDAVSRQQASAAVMEAARRMTGASRSHRATAQKQTGSVALAD